MGSAVSTDECKSNGEPVALDRTITVMNKNRTMIIRKSKRVQRGLTLQTNLQATLLGNLDVRKAVKLPPGEDLKEWLAVNTFMFYEIATNIHSMCSDFCTPRSCPVMSAGASFRYQWADGKKVKKGIAVSAPEYLDYMFEWIFGLMSDPTVFPQDDDSKFPKGFKKLISTIFKRLFRLFAHLFHSHYVDFQDIGSEAHLNSAFKHFACFILEFDLVEDSELRPLQNLIDKIIKKP